jgi:hypothetical protein
MHMRRLADPNCIAMVALATLLAFWRPGGATAQVSSASDAAAAARYVYWTNEATGAIGRANINGTGVNENFVRPVIAGTGAGMTVNKQYIYWTGANGGTATNILRAKLNGTGLNQDFIYVGEVNPCGVTVNSTYIYWGGDVGSAIGRANLNGTGVNANFITTGPGVCGVVVTSSYIYWANYETGWIGRANLNGTGVKQHFIPTLASSGIAVKGAFIYWANSNTGVEGVSGIGRAYLDGSGVKQDFIKDLAGEIAFLAVDSAHIYWADWGDRGTGHTIGRANLNGSGVDQGFVKGAHGGFGIAVTAGSP